MTLPSEVGDEGNTRTRIKPLEVLIPIGIALLALIVFVPSSPFFGLYLLALSALTIGPAFFLRSKGWGMLPLFLATPALGFSLDSFMTRLGWYNVQEYMDNSWPMGLSQDSIALAAGLALIGNAIFWLGFFLPLSRGLGERLFNKFKTSLTANTGQPREWRIWVAFAAGIITETGGALSHPAITAREYEDHTVVELLLSPAGALAVRDVRPRRPPAAARRPCPCACKCAHVTLPLNGARCPQSS